MQLVKRHKGNANTYRKSDGKMVLHIGGVHNHLPFDGGDEYQAIHLIHAETESIGAGFVRHHHGSTRIDVNLNAGTIRYYPMRGVSNKYIEIKDPVPPTPFIVNQIDDATVEYYIDYPTWRLTFLLSDLGIKTLITINDTYSGDGSFELGFRAVGLALDGQDIKDGDDVIMTMPRAFLYDADGTTRDVIEVYDNNSVTLSADLAGLVHPITYDPSLGPIEPDADGLMWEGAADTNYGNFVQGNQIYSAVNNSQRALWRFDVSAIPAGATVVSANFVNEVWQTALGQPIDFHLLDVGKEDWPEFQFTWNSYATGTLWDTAGGDYIGTPYLSTTAPAVGSWSTDHVVGVQTALDDRAGIFSTLLKFTTEQAGAYVLIMRNREYSTAALRPQLTVEYTAASTAAIPPHVFQRVR